MFKKSKICRTRQCHSKSAWRNSNDFAISMQLIIHVISHHTCKGVKFANLCGIL